MRRLLISVLGSVLVAGLLVGPTLAAKPSNGLVLGSEWHFYHGQWTDENGVECLSDENLWDRTWDSASAYTGTFTASLYLCPDGPNAPTGPDHYDLWASFHIGNGGGSASLTLTYPDGSIVPARYNPVTTWTEVCFVHEDFFGSEWMPGVYTLTFTADRARSVVLNFKTLFAEYTRGRYWWGCDPSWF